MAIDFQPLNPPKKTGINFKPTFDQAQSALAFSQSTLDRIRTGKAQQNVEVAKGFGKGALSTFSQAGAQNAGPVGADMLRGAPAFAENIGQLKQSIEPTNPLQAEGFGMERVAELTTPVTATTRTSAVAPGLIEKIGQGLKGIGKEAYKFLIPRSTKEAQLLQSYKARTPMSERLGVAFKGDSTKGPRTTAETAFDQNITGTEARMGVQAKRAQGKIWEEVVAPALREAKTDVDMDKFFASLTEEVVKETPELNRQADLLEGIEALSEAYKGKKVSTEDLQKFKEGWAEFVPEKFYKGKNIAGAFGEVKARAAERARTTIYDIVGDDVKEAYIDYGNLHSLVELGQKAMTGGRLKGGAGSFISAIKDMALTPIATVGGKTLYKTGDGIEFIGEAGARTLADLEIARILEQMLGGSEEESPRNLQGDIPLGQFNIGAGLGQ